MGKLVHPAMRETLPGTAMPNLQEHISGVRKQIIEADDKAFIDLFYHNTESTILPADRQSLLRRRVSDNFRVSMRDVILVGSAKIGCTLTQKLDRPPLSPFSDGSDIDIAIISSRLFEYYWEQAFNYYSDVREWEKIGQFRKYLFRGWMRPDMLPVDTEFGASRLWFDFFLGQTASGDFGGNKVSAGIYYSEHFWEKYASRSLIECRKYLELEGLK